MKAWTWVLALLVLGSACRRSEPEPEAFEDVLIVTGGTIITETKSMATAEAMAIRNGEVLRTGAMVDLEASYPGHRAHDLQGRTVIPGIIDSHVHVHELGADALKADLTGAQSIADMVARLQAFYPSPTADQWLIGQGWDEGVWGSKGYPDRAELDAAFPDHPVKLESLHGFAGFYNGKALAIAGIDRDTADPEVGNILRREDGEPTGVLLTLAQGLVNRHVPEPGPEQTEAAILRGLEIMAAEGVTSVHEAGMDAQRVAAFQALAQQGELPIRVYGMLDGNDDALMETWFSQGPLIDPDLWFTVRAIKVFYDGSLGSRTALLKEPYTDAPDENKMTERISPEKLRELAANALGTGFQMAVHAIGDEGGERMLTIFEETLREFPTVDHRWRNEHAQVVLPDYYERAATLGVISSMQPSHAVGDSKWAEDRLGPARIRHAYAWQRMLEAGVPLILNSDLPGEPWAPRHTLYFAVTRKNLEGEPKEGWYPDQALPLAEALYAMTGKSAYAAFQENKLGWLAPGSLADFVELDRDPRALAPEALKDLRVMRTWVAGKVVYEAAAE